MSKRSSRSFVRGGTRGRNIHSQLTQIELVRLVDNLQKGPRGLFESIRRDGSKRIHVCVIDRVVDDVEARCIGVHEAKFTTWAGFSAGVQRDSVVFESLRHNRLELIA